MRASRQAGLLGLVVLAAAGVTYFASFCWTKTHDERPKIEYSRTLELGERDLGEIAAASFRVANRGQSTLELSQFRTSCSCAGVEIVQDGRTRRVEKARIEPGGFVDLSVRVSVGAPPGSEQFVEVIFATNDPSQPTGKIDVTVQRVKGAVFVSPNSVVFGAIPLREHAARIVEVYDNGVRNRQVESIRSSNPDRFEARFLPISESTKRQHEFAGHLIARFEIIARTDRTGPREGNVELVCSDDKRTKVLVSITGKVYSDVALYPSAVVLPRSSSEGLLRYADVLLVDRMGRPFEADLEEVPKGLTAKLQATERDGQMTLHVECEENSGGLLDAVQSSSIRFRTTLKGGVAQHQELVILHPLGGK